MTTIATDGKSMAGDGQYTGEGVIHGTDAVKIKRLSDGRIVGASGSLYDLEPFVQWLVEGGEKPNLSDSFEALVLETDGTCLTYNHRCQSASQMLPSASGSGAPVAIGAMEAGATPEQAVAISARRDCYTGGTITALHLAERQLRAA